MLRPAVGTHIIWDRTALSRDPEGSVHPMPPFSVLRR